jgi:hypothetical protein
MNFNLGFKALAYPASNTPAPLSPCQCSLAFRCDDTKRATVLLVAKIPTAHDTQTFVLQYDADELLSGTVGLQSGNAHIPRQQLDELLRDKDNKHYDIKTLSLRIAQPCPFWCPHAPSFSPQPGCEASFRQFVELARATAIHVVFDYKHLRKEQQGMFRAFSKVATGLTGYAVEASLSEHKLRRASWEVFSPLDAVGAPPAYDASPAYDGPRKRPRLGEAGILPPSAEQLTRAASPNSPTQCRKRFAPRSPTESDSSEKTIPFSPATAEALERALRKASPEFDLQLDAINAAIDKQLPAHLEKALPALLPDILQGLLAGRSISSPPATSIDSHGDRSPKLPPLTPLGRALIPHLRTHLAKQFQDFQAHQLQRFETLVENKLTELWDNAYDARVHENAVLTDEMEEHKAEVSMLKEDTIKDLWREAEDVFARSKEEGWSLGLEISDQLLGVCDRIDQVKRVGLRKMVAGEVSRQKRRRKGVSRGVGKRLVRGEQRLLGRRRNTEDVEWVDC